MCREWWGDGSNMKYCFEDLATQGGTEEIYVESASVARGQQQGLYEVRVRKVVRGPGRKVG